MAPQNIPSTTVLTLGNKGHLALIISHTGRPVDTMTFCRSLLVIADTVKIMYNNDDNVIIIIVVVIIISLLKAAASH